jgi:hypothetical protein
MRPPSAFRWFAAVSSPPVPLTAVFAVLAAGAAALEIVDRGSSDWVLASIALIQLFAASTGFTRHASRGYYDPVLLGRSRVPIAFAHFAASAAPGVVAWIACGAVQAIAARSASVPAFRPAGWAALLLVSTIPWAVSVRAAPLVGGTLWLLLSVSFVVSGRVLEPLGRLHAQPLWALEHPATALGLGLAFPFAIPSMQWPSVLVLAFSGIAGVALACGVFAVARAEFPLAEEGS